MNDKPIISINMEIIEKNPLRIKAFVEKIIPRFDGMCPDHSYLSRSGEWIDFDGRGMRDELYLDVYLEKENPEDEWHVFDLMTGEELGAKS